MATPVPVRFLTFLPIPLTLALAFGCSGNSAPADALVDLPTDVSADAAQPECLCGNGLCEAACAESIGTCPYDCKACGDGICSPSEGPIHCAPDCCGGCGDGTCRGYDCGESPTECPSDCGTACGDKVCGKGESPAGCAMDCAWQVCGNGICEPADGGPDACPGDCAAGCGDCDCGGAEDWQACPIDCGYCGDGVCSPCDRLREDSATCPKDCGAVVLPGADVIEPGDIPAGDSSGPEADVPPVRLAFADAYDDRGNATDGLLAFFVDLPYGTKRDLKVRLTQGGAPVPDAAVTFEVFDDPAGLGRLGAAVVLTDASGIGIGSIAAADARSGEFGVAACAKDVAGAPCLEFRVAVDCECAAVLTVTVAPPAGAADVTRTRVLLYRQGVTGAPGCADMTLDDLPTAAVASPWIAPGQTASFQELPGLAQNLAQSYTVLALGATDAGAVVARACDDDSATVEWGQNSHLDLALAGISPRIAGTYAVVSSFNLADGLPPDAATAVYRVSSLLANPAAESLIAACREACATTDFCAYVFVDPAHPTVDGLTVYGKVVLQVLESRATAMAAASCPLGQPAACAKVWWTEANLTQLLRKVGLNANFEFLAEPSLAGAIGPAHCRASWHSMRLWWTAGLSCPADDDACGSVTTTLGAIPGIAGPLPAEFGASVAPGWTLAIEPHSVDMPYGRIADFAFEGFLLPRLFGNGADGLPAVTSFEVLFGALGGGRACLADDTCCTAFATDVTGLSTGLSQGVLEGACEAMRTCGAGSFRALLTGIDGTGGGLTLSTQAPCKLFDTDADAKFDGFGTADAACIWQASMAVGSSEFHPSGTFLGDRK